MYFETDFYETKNLARIESPLLDQTESDFCMEFWYFIDGNYMTTLNVVQNNSKTNTEDAIWRTRGISRSWQKATIPLSSNDMFSIIIEGYNNYKYTSA